MSFADWSVAKGAIVGPWDKVNSKMCWVLMFSAATPGRLLVQWQTAAGSQSATSTAGVPFTGGAVGYVRATVDPASGAATFYTSTDGTTWAQLGAVVNGTAGNIVALGANAFMVGGQYASGDTAGAGSFLSTCQIYEVAVLIGGTTVASPIFAGKTAGTATFADAQGRNWTIVAPAAIVNP